VTTALPDPALVVLAGASGSGKSAWAAARYRPQAGRDWEPIPEPWVTLGMLAGLAPGLRLGTLVTPVTFRAPGILAKTVATLDVLTGGRAFCGIGAGWWDREHAAFGLPFPPAGARLDQLEAAIETLRALWAPGTKPYQGERISLPETTCYPRPVSAVPIIVGGSGERRTLRIAARLATAATSRPTSAPWTASWRCWPSTAARPGATPPRCRSPCPTCRSSAKTGRMPPRSSRGSGAGPRRPRSPGAITAERPRITSAVTGCSPSAACLRFSSPCPI
jgi:alkanesulfonate monooxygenase SsuD/methylene tetrahydromethanopterin reductase-like flavin-dependent oxidoreductase (luciferase family)